MRIVENMLYVEKYNNFIFLKIIYRLYIYKTYNRYCGSTTSTNFKNFYYVCTYIYKSYNLILHNFMQNKFNNISLEMYFVKLYYIFIFIVIFELTLN